MTQGVVNLSESSEKTLTTCRKRYIYSKQSTVAASGGCRE